MKQYVKKQFESGEKYVEAIPAGYPAWWDEFKTLVNDSLSLETLNLNLMNFKPFGTIPRNINGQIVFNPLVYDFLIKNHESLETFNKGHKNGKKDFKKNYFKKYPNEAQAKTIFTLFNNEFKQIILRGDGFFNNSNIMMLGYYNGILTGYWQFENDHLTQFEITENKIDEKEPTNLNEFFPNVDEKTVQAIQNEFKDLTGKPMAVLIYLLTKEFDLVSIDNNDRHSKSNLHFVRSFTGDKELKSIQGVNNYLEGVTGELKRIDKKDKSYIQILKRLKPIVSNG